MKNFSDVVEEVKELNLDEKEQFSRVLDRLIAEERREEIFSNYQEARSLKRAFNSAIHLNRSENAFPIRMKIELVPSFERTFRRLVRQNRPDEAVFWNRAVSLKPIRPDAQNA